jgi:hypothetical protein
MRPCSLSYYRTLHFDVRVQGPQVRRITIQQWANVPDNAASSLTKAQQNIWTADSEISPFAPLVAIGEANTYGHAAALETPSNLKHNQHHMV